ncbi:MAG: hypothetical protein ABEL04_13485 [Salinibacter sp.]|uniref:hypothetical protein n=1 Tax=Salinibacter sp. TaxID=2065818 RepID=UPI0035D406D7
MNTLGENDDSSNTGSSDTDPSTHGAPNTDSSNTDSSGKSAPGKGEKPGEGQPPAGPDGPPPAEKSPESEKPLTAEEWARLRAPFSWNAYIVDHRAIGHAPRHLGGRAEGDDRHPAVVDLRLRPEAIRDRLDRVLGPERWSYRLEVGPQAGGHYSLLCHLQVGPARRTGPGAGSTMRTARRIALAGAALAFGIGASGRSAGPIEAEIELRNEVPDRVLEALEQETEPSRWTPDEA